jgi:segregation and condensation protein A
LYQLSTDEQGFIVRLEDFSGPLDLLLHLIREQEIDITDIPIAQVADQFIAAIESLGLNQAAAYLEMAARLLRLKIQMLLPRPIDDEEWEDPRAELVRRLLEYEQVREVVDWLMERATRRADRFPRGFEQDMPELPPRPVVFDMSELLRAVDDVVAGIPRPVLHRVVPRPLDVEGATRRITALLAERETITLSEVFGVDPTPADVISALIAILELARLGRVRLAQREPFGPVDVRRESIDEAA